ncbi:hypothetical protein BH23GEM1_BH23GEM1_06760 [soil metagenome]
MRDRQIRSMFPLAAGIAVLFGCAPATGPAQQPPAAPPTAATPAPNPGPMLGSMAPDFALPAATRYGLTARPFRLSDYRGETVVLAFFSRARTRG